MSSLYCSLIEHKFAWEIHCKCQKRKKKFNLLIIQPTIASKLCLTAGTEQIKEPNIPVRAYAMAQNGSASGSLADNAAVPSPWALQTNRKRLNFWDPGLFLSCMQTSFTWWIKRGVQINLTNLFYINWDDNMWLFTFSYT